jgi:hypothetical protein
MMPLSSVLPGLKYVEELFPVADLAELNGIMSAYSRSGAG